MAALDFPDAPTNGQVFDKWTWNGTAWLLTSSGGGLSQAAADALYVNVTGDTINGALNINSAVTNVNTLTVKGFAAQTNVLQAWYTSAGAALGYFDINGGMFARQLHLNDTDNSHFLRIKPNSNLTANRILNLVTGDADRTLTLGANVALNQDVQTVDAVTFARVRVTTNPGIVLNSNPIYLKTEADSVHQIYASDLSTATPFADGPMLLGYSGWAHYNSFNGWAMGWRGSYVRPYMWMNGALMVGTTPNDSIASLPGKIYAANNVSATQCEGRATVNEMYDSGAILANAGGHTAGPVGITLHPGGFATQIRQAYNDGSPYFRNLNNTGYPQVFMDVTDMSSLRYKEDVRSLVEDRQRGTVLSSLNIVRQLRPIRYRVRKEQRLIQTDFTIHECGPDCIGPEAPDYTTTNTCPQYRAWERGTAGFVAEELDALLPEASMRNAHDQPEGVKTLAIVAVLTDALQELIERVEQLEGGA